jgi:hypothetical protein
MNRYIIIFILCIPLLLISCQKNDKKDLVLGFGKCSPVIFCPIETPLTIKIYDIKYAYHGGLAGFSQSIKFIDRDPINLKVEIDLERFNGICNSLRYKVLMDGETLESPDFEKFKEGKHLNKIGISIGHVIKSGIDPVQRTYELEGVVVYDSKGKLKHPLLDIEDVYYKKFGNILLPAKQSFRLEEEDYLVKYFDYTYADYTIGTTNKSKTKNISGITIKISAKTQVPKVEKSESKETSLELQTMSWNRVKHYYGNKDQYLTVKELLGPPGATIKNIIPGTYVARGTYDLTGSSFTNGTISLGFLGKVSIGAGERDFLITEGQLTGTFEVNQVLLEMFKGPFTPYVDFTVGHWMHDRVELY